jgi:hypothetical protein
MAIYQKAWLWRVVGLTIFALLAQNRPAAAQILTFKSTGIEEHGPALGPSQKIVTGNWTLETLTHNLVGGTATATFHVTSGLGPGNVPCAGRNQKVSFAWRFNRDATYITTSEPLSVQLFVSADTGACAPNDPYIYTSPIGYFTQSPPLDESTNPVFAQIPSGYVNQSIRGIMASTFPQYAGGFSVYLIGNRTGAEGELAIRIDYNYQNISNGPPVAAPPPSGGCNQTNWVVSPMSGSTLTESQISAGGASCAINITTNLKQASVIITVRPSHGTLTQTGPLSLVYRPSPGFRGTDSYSFRYCGSNGAETGCSTLNYTVQVE